jgi:phytol kinase
VIPAQGTLAGEAARLALIGALAVVLLAATEMIHRRWHPPAEWTRKAVHVGGGLLAMAFPWVFGSPLTVAVLCVVVGALIAIAGRLGWLTGVKGVERKSRGEIYHPIAIALLFLLARERPIFYVVSLWTLVVADAAAALLGRSYGRHTYAVEEDRKSLEGSMIFFFVAFLGIHVPLLLFTGISREASIVVALQLALIVTCFEAISMQGADNLVVPLATYYLLLKLTPASAAGIVLQLAVQVALLTGALLLARVTHFLSWSGAVAAHLTLYAAFSLGGPAWTVAPALALAGFVRLDRRGSRDSPAPEGRHQVRGVFYASIVAVMCIALDNSFATFAASHVLALGHPFFVPFVAALAGQLAIGLLRVRRGWWPAGEAAARAASGGTLAGSMALSVLVGFVAVVPLSLLAVPQGRSLAAMATAAGICIASVLIYTLAYRRIRLPEGQLWELRRQAAAVATAVLIWFPAHLAIRGVGP